MIKHQSKSFSSFKPNSKRQNQSAAKKSVEKNSKQIQQADIVINVATAFGNQALRGKPIDFKILLKCTNETFNVVNFPLNMKIRDLKACLEFICGIPFNLQRLSYLDDGELIDTKEVQFYDVIDGAVIVMDIWTIYAGLVKASVFGDIDDALKQGVSNSVEWNSPTSDYMFIKDKNKYIQERSGIALFISSHRGNTSLVKGLISHGASINYKSSYGRTPLMVSVVANRTEIIDYLLGNNADIDITDINGDTALSIAKKFNNKLGQHRLTQFKWKKRTEAELRMKKDSAKNQEEEIFSEKRLPHQIFDSSKKTWLKGNFMQVYMVQLVPQGEFSGSGISAPRSVGKQVLKQHKQTRSLSELKINTLGSGEHEESENSLSSPVNNALTFDKWLAQKLKAKRLEQQKLKKAAEAEKESENQKEETSKETTTQLNLEPDNNVWMKDYSKPPNTASRFDLLDPNRKATIQSANINLNSTNTNANANNGNSNANTIANNLNSTSVGSMNSTRASKNLDLFNIYKGMSYDEWAKIRDSFLKSHNMI